MVSPEHYQSRSQDLEPIYHDSGQFYWMRTGALKKEMRFFAERTAALVLSEIEVQDIDSEEDWQMAELKYRLLNGSRRQISAAIWLASVFVKLCTLSISSPCPCFIALLALDLCTCMVYLG
jgi:hypothetical protein